MKSPGKPPKKSTPHVETSGHDSGSGSKGIRAASSAASRALTTALGQVNNKLMQIANENPGDKDLMAALDSLNKVLDAKSFIDNPAQFTAQTIKNDLIQGVFGRFSTSLDTARQTFVDKFPDVPTLHNDPVNTGISLEGYEKNYNAAMAALRMPDARKAAMYTFVLLGTNEKTPRKEIERRIGIANEGLAGLPGLGEYVKKYNDAKTYYGASMFAVSNRLITVSEELAQQPAGMAGELRRRGDALLKAAAALNDVYAQLMNSGLVVFAPVEEAAMDLQMLAEGFSGLGDQFHEFADLIGLRKDEYARDIKRIEVQSDKLEADAHSPF